jgi:hypothetical protein
VSIDDNVTKLQCYRCFIPLQSATSSAYTQRHPTESTCSTILKPKCSLEQARHALLPLLPSQAEMGAEAAGGVRLTGTGAGAAGQLAESGAENHLLRLSIQMASMLQQISIRRVA